MWDRIPAIFRNKYFLISVAFIIWIGFLDRNNLVYTYKNQRILDKLNEERSYYTNEIEITRKSLHDLRYNNRTFEKFAREHYLLKREREEIFLIDESEPKMNKEDKTVADTTTKKMKIK